MILLRAEPPIRRKELSPVELMPCPPRLRASAFSAKLMQGEATGSLFGLPVTIKDLTETAGIPTQRGSHSLKGHVPTVDAPIIPRLEEAGAIILGKTTTSEFGWSGVSHCPLTGITSNPVEGGL